MEITEEQISDREDTSSTLEEAAREAINECLPSKSIKLYEKQYDDFVKWCNSKGTRNFTENVLLVYFSEKSKSVASSTLWSYYSMLKSMILVKKDIDISKYCKLIAFIKQKKKQRIFAKEIKNLNIRTDYTIFDRSYG